MFDKPLFYNVWFTSWWVARDGWSSLAMAKVLLNQHLPGAQKNYVRHELTYEDDEEDAARWFP